MMKFRVEQMMSMQMVRRFDEVISEKCGKHYVKQTLHDYETKINFELAVSKSILDDLNSTMR